MTKLCKKVAIVSLFAAVAAMTAGGLSGLQNVSADVTEILPIAKYEFKDASDFGKDSMGNYDMSYRNAWVEGGTGPLLDKGTLIEGGGVEFNGEFCLSQDMNNNIFQDVTAFTLAFEIRTASYVEWQHYLGAGGNSANYFAVVGRGGEAGSAEAKQAIFNAAGTNAGTYWDGAWLSESAAWGDAETAFQKVIISAQPGGTLNIYVNGVAYVKEGKVPAELSASWSPYDASVPFSVGARYNGAADMTAKGALKNVVFYDFAMDAACAAAYNANGKVTPADVSGMKTITGLTVTKDSFAGEPTKTVLYSAMTPEDMLAQMNAANATVLLSDQSTLTAPVTWTGIVREGDRYFAQGTVDTRKLGFANGYGNVVSYELTVAEIREIGEPVFADGKVTSGELKDSMTEEEMLVLVNKAQVKVVLPDGTEETVEVTFTRIEGVMGVYTAYGDVILNGTSVGTAQVIVEVTETNEGDTMELLPVALWEFEDPSDIGKDSMGNYNLGPAAKESGDLGNPLGTGTIEDGRLYLNGQEILTCNALNDVGDNLNNGFTLNFQYQQDGIRTDMDWSAPVSFGFNDWTVTTTCRFLIGAGSTQLRVGAHGGVAAFEDGNTFWGPVVLEDGTDRMHNITLSVRPGEKFNVYVDGQLAYSADCPAGWNVSHSNMSFSIGGECVWGNGYDMFRGWIDNVSIYNFALTLEQSNAYWEKGKIVVKDMDGEIITSISETPVFADGEVTNGTLTDRLTDTQAVRRVNAATVDAVFENGKTVALNVTWQRLEQQNGTWYIVGVVDTNDIGYASSLTGAQTVRQEVTVERAVRSVTVQAGIAHGKMTADKEEAYLGDVITFTLTPDEGYEVGSVTVNGVPLMANEGVYVYTVEGIEDIEASATFKAVSQSGEQDPEDPGQSDPEKQNLLPVILGVAGGVVVLAAVVAVVVIVKKKKENKQD